MSDSNTNNHSTPRAPYTLAVIDMQTKYGAARDRRTIDNVASLIQQAMREEAGIVIVEYARNGGTIASLMRILSGYRFWTRAIKRNSNGGNIILDACEESGFNVGHIVVCGVQTHCCVADSVTSLCKQLPGCKVEVVTDACNDPDGSDWSIFPMHRERTRRGFTVSGSRASDLQNLLLTRQNATQTRDHVTPDEIAELPVKAPREVAEKSGAGILVAAGLVALGCLAFGSRRAA